jgi:hypothetical protein
MGLPRIEPAELLPHWQPGRESISLGGHDEVITVQAADLMRPPGNGDAAPLRENGGMMSFGLGERANFICELEGFGEVLQTKGALQLGNSVALDDLPVWDLWLEFGDLLVGDSRGIAATGGAFGFF